MKTNPTQRRGFTLVELLVVIVIIASLAGLTAPMVIRQRKKADQTEATSNARQIGLAMFEFETEYGSFPDAETATEVTENNPDGTVDPTTEDSNGYFRQLFRANITQSEQMFYAKTGLTKKPDGDINGVEALADREVGFGYMLNTENGLSTAGNPARVIAMTPLAEGGENFNPDPFDKKAVLLRIDNSVASVNINNDGEALLGGGKTLTQSGADTIWGTSITPTIVAPSE
ncbi:type II secretion system protein [Luteolibacter algae]|uniref:Type II secretion system protein n=1 Tax=Luteolibacter algae TaxID=454151 RepID=A0ABW5D3U6_9BACT